MDRHRSPLPPNPIDSVRVLLEASNRADWDRLLSFVAPDAVWEATGLGTSFEGVGAIRDFLEEWSGAYRDWEIDVEEILDLGHGVTLHVAVQKGHPVGSTGQVRWRFAQVLVWTAGVVVRTAVYADVDEARTAAERLAKSRG
jgi:ketosteroid isomerase-like protein